MAGANDEMSLGSSSAASELELVKLYSARRWRSRRGMAAPADGVG
jgi:hypothetical protein